MLIFDTDADLQQHSETVHASNALQVDGDNAWQCNVCYKLFTCSTALENHQNTVYFLRYQCYTCGLLFGTQAHLARHEFKHMRGKFTCEPCEKIFSNPQSMRRHMQRFHDKSRTLRTQEKHICSECGKACAVCGVMFGRLNQCNAHERNHTARKVNCVACGKEFNNSKSLYRHEQIVHVDPNSRKKYICNCNICYQTFTTACGMRVHQRAMRVLRYQCAVCGKLFGNRAACIIHETNHEDHQLSCDLCAKKFTNRKYLNIHKQNVHTDPETRKKYVCNVCGTSLCCTLKHLMHHERTHSEPSYSCADCGKEFVHEMQLRNHREAKHLDKSARKKYVCDVCGKELLAKVSLRKHTLVMHSGERPYACNLCDARFQIKAYLTSHMTVHNR
ncbi:AGAP007971-PA, partial [Anopheles gambiae str. PEST]